MKKHDGSEVHSASRADDTQYDSPSAGPLATASRNKRVPTEHELKVWPEFYRVIASGEKTFEVRKDDRGFRAGDVLWLREWRRLRIVDGKAEGEYTGRELRRTVTYLLSGFGLERGFVCMALSVVSAEAQG